jgi:hypothetical protein
VANSTPRFPFWIRNPTIQALSARQVCSQLLTLAVVTSCGRICLYNKKINLSVSLAGQAVGVKEVDDGIWLVSFMDYDLGYIDLEEKTLQPLEEPLRAESVTYVSGTFCYLCLRNGQRKDGRGERI